MDKISFSLENIGINLPYNIEAEQAVIGAALLKADCLPQLVEKLRPEYFYSEKNGEIFGELLRLFASGSAIDFVTVLSAVINAGIFTTQDEAKVYLTGVAETVPSISNIDAYADLVYEKHLVRRLMNAAKDILAQAGEEADAAVLLEAAEQKIYEIRAGRDNNAMQPISTSIIEAYEQLRRISGPDKDKYLGVPTGFTYLDKMLTGLGRSDLIILAARPAMGKTSFALNIATNIAKKQRVPVAVFSLEMTKDQLTTRILSSEAGVDSQKLRMGTLTGDDWAVLAQAGEVLAQTHIFLDDTSSITVPEMKAKIRRLNQDPQKPDVGVVIIDYLQLMSSAKRTESRVQEVSEITRSLKIMAKELNVPILCLSQLSRNTERGTGRDRRPMLSDLRDSGSIEQDADSVMFLYREAYYKNREDDDNDEEVRDDIAECIIGKNRHGEVGTVKLGWDGAHTKFLNIEYSHDEY